ncbi:protein FAM53A isoform X2 [Fukomys damarensis]|uniref:protein FAM53A isoform X2 n=1 Tax=Fukomys damarensis TaxID=885580 RepID=UPI00054010A2|nr:protein FAM53A isoform X2 [Fukomys damarensis]
MEAGSAVVTVITEKLQNQSLDDLTRRIRGAGLCSAERLTRSDHLFPLEVSVDRSPWKTFRGGWPTRRQAAAGPSHPFLPAPCGATQAQDVQWQPESPAACTGLGVGSAVDLRESMGPTTAPLTKRHCRSLSELEELARCWSPWRPSGSKVWTPVSKRRCNSGGSATLQCCSGLVGTALPRSPVSPVGPASPLAPRPASASSGFVDSSEGSTGSEPSWYPTGPCLLSSRRRLSLSQEHLEDTGGRLPSASSTPTSTPELGQHHSLLRCHSQPCVLGGRRSRCKRRREEDTRWTRPSLDFLKMTRTLRNSKSLCSLDYEANEEDDTQVKTVVSSPCDSQGLVSIVMPGSSPWTSGEPEAGEGEGGSSGDPSDWDSAGEEGVFPLDHGDLDLEQIENN